MTIKQVEVKRLFGLPDYQNITFGYTALVGDNESPESVKNSLWNKIQDDYLNYTKTMREMEHKANEERLLRAQKWEEQKLTEKGIKMLEAIDRMEAFLKDHGVEFKEFNRDELPF